MLPLAVRRRRRGYGDALDNMERMFSDMMRPLVSDQLEESTGAYPVDIREEDGKLVVDAEMPGFKPEEVDINIDKGVLSIHAERKPEESKGTQHLSERRYTRVERSFTLPTPVDEEHVDARMKDGVLHLELPESEESKPRRIPVKS